MEVCPCKIKGLEGMEAFKSLKQMLKQKREEAIGGITLIWIDLKRQFHNVCYQG